MPISDISDGEAGSSVRAKLNEAKSAAYFREQCGARTDYDIGNDTGPLVLGAGTIRIFGTATDDGALVLPDGSVDGEVVTIDSRGAYGVFSWQVVDEQTPTPGVVIGTLKTGVLYKRQWVVSTSTWASYGGEPRAGGSFGQVLLHDRTWGAVPQIAWNSTQITAGTANTRPSYGASGEPITVPDVSLESLPRTFSGTIAPDTLSVSFATFNQSGAQSFTKGSGAYGGATLHLPFNSNGDTLTWNAGFRLPGGGALPTTLAAGLWDIFFHYHAARNDILVVIPGL